MPEETKKSKADPFVDEPPTSATLTLSQGQIKKKIMRINSVEKSEIVKPVLVIRKTDVKFKKSEEIENIQSAQISSASKE